jgi:hypothetical protein
MNEEQVENNAPIILADMRDAKYAPTIKFIQDGLKLA